MKKTLIIAALLIAGFGSAFASGTSLSELLGQYTCATPGLKATLEISGQQGDYQIEYCRSFVENASDCIQADVMDEVSNDRIVLLEGQSAREQEGMVVQVRESQGQISLIVQTNDGLQLEFTK